MLWDSIRDAATMALLLCTAMNSSRRMIRGTSVTFVHALTFSSRTSASSSPLWSPTSAAKTVRSASRLPFAFLPDHRTQGVTASHYGTWKKSCSVAPLSQSTTAVEEELTTQCSKAERTVVTHPSYEIESQDFVQEYGALCTRYIHQKSGAELLSVSTDDDNKVFGITFRTPPSDSTGVPHILEHSVLCGSRKFTTKDPFVQLLQGSLQTFLNAFTYPDRTCYVLASQNQKDFYNLIHVYTDAVFHPRAVSDPRVLAQEGWHLELEDKNQPLTYKGVVYNEMKGVYSSPDSLLNRESQRSLFPDNTYSVDSGGDPVVIPNLSFEQFVDFHSKFYHPSNSRIFFAGDDDVYTRLEMMDSYLSEFEKNPQSKPSSVIEWQSKTIVDPRWEKHFYPVASNVDPSLPTVENTHMINVNWLLNDRPLSSTEDLVLAILNHLLMGTPQSILYKTLMESGLGTAVTGGGLSDELKQATFSVGLKGIAPSNVASVQNLILETLEKVAVEGFDHDDIAASMNTIEFRLREFNTGSFPRGLSLMLGAMSKWIYDANPTDALKFENSLSEIKLKIAESGSKIFQDCQKEFLVENRHRVTVEMVPSTTLEAEQLMDEQNRLQTIKASLSDSELDDIIRKTVELKEMQAAEDSAEARATIPKLGLADLKREVTEYPIAVTQNENDSGVTVIRHELASTSGIAYLTIALDISRLSLEDVVLLPLFTRLLEEAGAGDYSDVALSRRIGMHTGGVDVSYLIRPVRPEGIPEGTVYESDHLISKLVFKGKATKEKTGEQFSIIQLILNDAKLDSQKKVIEMLKETKATLEARIQGSGHSFANTRMKARYRVSSYIDEIMGGITYLESMGALIHEAEHNWDVLLGRLTRIRDTILDDNTCRDGMFVDITGESGVMEAIRPSLNSFLLSLPGSANTGKLQDFYKTEHPWVRQAKEKMKDSVPMEDEGFIVPTQVNYVGKAGQLYNMGERISGSAAVVSRFLRTGYLWDYVRVIGGAYGGFCSFNPKDGDGLFTYLSYRDPNLVKTLEVYDGACEALAASVELLENDSDALATAIIGAMGDMDGSLSPDQKGAVALNRWISRESAEHRQKYRDEVLNTKPSDFKEFAERLRKLNEPSVAVVSSRASLEAAQLSRQTLKLKQII